jgi:hypothetical protein
MVARAIALRKAGDDAQALDWYERALAIDPAPRTKAHRALTLQALGRSVEAEAGLREALEAGGDAWIARRRAELEASLKIIESRIGTLVVDCDTSGAELLVDGRTMGPIAKPGVRVAIGGHELTVRAPGYRDATARVDVAAGATVETRIALTAEEVAPSPSTPTAVASTSPPAPVVPPPRVAPEPAPAPAIPPTSLRRTVGLATGGVAGAALAVGAVYGLKAIATRGDRDAQCHPVPSCNQTGVDLDSTGRGQATVATIAFAVGVVALGAGTYLMFSASPSAASAASAGPRSASLGVGGVW